MRIISGKLGGRKLFPISGNRIRPTSDRVREAIFNILAHRTVDARVLDLFAGTGALGIESASRGARAITCIDTSQNAIQTIRKNSDHLDLVETIRTIKWDIARNLNCIQAVTPDYDLVFMDPPYEQGLVAKALDNLHQSASVIPGATLVVEHAGREPIPEDRVFLALLDQRRYGKTLVSFLEYVV
jgi:16S rRNA (guanine966-N2)-methyltransferase